MALGSWPFASLCSWQLRLALVRIRRSTIRRLLTWTLEAGWVPFTTARRKAKRGAAIRIQARGRGMVTRARLVQLFRETRSAK